MVLQQEFLFDNQNLCFYNSSGKQAKKMGEL